MIKTVLLPSLCLASFFGAMVLGQMPQTAEKEVKEPKKKFSKLETSMPLLAGTEKVGYCEIYAEVAFKIEDLASAQAQLYDRLLSVMLDEAASPQANCANYTSFTDPYIKVTKTEFARAL
ncbi:MAG: hypothetical protein AAFY99_13215 [Pseudomonadota bacterium]